MVRFGCLELLTQVIARDATCCFECVHVKLHHPWPAGTHKIALRCRLQPTLSSSWQCCPSNGLRPFDKLSLQLPSLPPLPMKIPDSKALNVYRDHCSIRCAGHQIWHIAPHHSSILICAISHTPASMAHHRHRPGTTLHACSTD